MKGDTLTGIDNPKKIEKGLRKIHRNKIIVLSLFIGFGPFAILFSFVAEALRVNPMIFIGAYFIFVMALGSYVGLTSNCPRCNELYYWKKSGIGYRNIFTKKCLNCGLELKSKSVREEKSRLP